MKFKVEPNPRCLRGLSVLYKLSSSFELDEMAQRLQDVFEGQLVQTEERWGATHRVVRLVLQLRAEWRLGVRAGEIVFMYRTCASPEVRAADTERFESMLSALP